jgi:hypothetical protein
MFVQAWLKPFLRSPNWALIDADVMFVQAWLKPFLRSPNWALIDADVMFVQAWLGPFLKSPSGAPTDYAPAERRGDWGTTRNRPSARTTAHLHARQGLTRSPARGNSRALALAQPVL